MTSYPDFEKIGLNSIQCITAISEPSKIDGLIQIGTCRRDKGVS